MCLAGYDAVAGAPDGAVMSGLAAWFHHHGWPVEIVASSRPAQRDDLDEVPVGLLEQWESRRWSQLDPTSSAVAGLAFRLRRLSPWLVHAFTVSGAVAAQLAEHPYVLAYRSMTAPDTFTGRPDRWRLFTLATEGAGAVVCPSRAAAEHLETMFHVRAHVVPDGVDVARFSEVTVERQPGLVVCVADADDERARLDVLVDAFARVAREVPHAELVVVGPCSEQRRRQLIARLPDHARGRLRVVGAADRSRTAQWQARAAVVCLPAVAQASAPSLVEALAAGTPVVGADSGAIPEVVGPDVGSLFTPDDALTCARALRDVLERSATDPSLPAACRDRAARYDWSEVGPQLLRIYQEVTEHSAGG